MNLENRRQGQLPMSTFDMTTHVYILTFPQIWVGAILAGLWHSVSHHHLNLPSLSVLADLGHSSFHCHQFFSKRLIYVPFIFPNLAVYHSNHTPFDST
jgi:hypothetical protein